MLMTQQKIILPVRERKLHFIRIPDDISFIANAARAKAEAAIGMHKSVLNLRVHLARYLQRKGTPIDAARMFTSAARSARTLRAHGLSAALHRRAAQLFLRADLPREAASALLLATSADLAAERIRSADRTHSKFVALKKKLSPSQIKAFADQEAALIRPARRRLRKYYIAPPEKSPIPALIKAIKEKTGFIQADLAKVLSVCEGAVAAWESGRSVPRSETRRKIEELFEQYKEAPTVIRPREKRQRPSPPPREKPPFPELIKSMKQSTGITQTNLAKLLGVTRPAVSSWESGRRTPQNELRQKLEKLLALDKDALRSMLEESRSGVNSIRKYPHGSRKIAFHIPMGTTRQVAPEVAQQVKAVLKAASQERSALELLNETGLKHSAHFRLSYLQPLLAAGLLERTIPDKPSSRLQKYRLTKNGKNFIDRG